VRLLAAQEFTDGGSFDTTTTRVGFQVVPWKGARLDSTLNQSRMSEYGPRTFGQFGLTQAVLLDKHWSLDLATDTSRTFRESGQAPVLNPNHPVAPGGTVGAAGATEDYFAVSARCDLSSGHLELERPRRVALQRKRRQSRPDLQLPAPGP